MSKRLSLNVFNMEQLKEKYPDAVKVIQVEKEDHAELYKKAKAHAILGLPIPGVIITLPDGRILQPDDAPKAELTPEQKEAALQAANVTAV